jgi:hypothetical protein
MANLKQYKFIGTVLPNGIPSSKPNEVIFSICLNINKYCGDFSTDGTSEEVQARYNNFYNGLQQIKTYLSQFKNFDFEIKTPSKPNPITVSGIGSDNPFEYFCNESDFVKGKPDLEKIKTDLWNQIFPSVNKANKSIQINNASKLSFTEIKEINSLLDEKNDLLHINSFAINNKTNQENILEIKRKLDGKFPEPKIKELLNSINEFGQISERIAFQEKVNFLTQNIDNKEFEKKIKSTISTLFAEDFKERSISEEEKKLAISFLLDIKNEATEKYLKSQKIDIDEVVNSFNAITNEPALMRLMGLVKDFKIDLKDIDSDTFSISPLGLSSDIFSLPTEIVIIKNKAKTKSAYLVKSNSNCEKYFTKSVLKGNSSSLRSFDVVSKTLQLIDYSGKILNGDQVKYNENKDALTRGILYTNKDLHKIIQPVSLVYNNGDLVSSFTDEFVTRGHRVAVRVNENSKTNLYSLTGRSISLKLKQDKKPFYYCGNSESCVHFDTPIAYMENGEVKAASSDVLFEYSGELLKLKSAFSKANKISKADKISDEAEFHHDGGLYKSIARFEQIDDTTKAPLNGTVIFSHFPFNEIQKEAWLNCVYSIPSSFNKNFSPKLRFGNNYTFAVYQEYLNGWGLPLYTQNSVQLSLEEIIQEDSTGIFPEVLEFQPLENKKTVLLYHRRDVSEDLSKPIFEKPSLEHLVVRSDTGEDSKQFIDERHVLPPKITIETAFWYGLLSQLSNDKSFEYKKRANCPFADKGAYNKFIDETDENGISKENKCVECGKSYCGGTQMEKYYSDKHIFPNHFFTDPSIKGFTVKFFWDEECSDNKEIRLNEIGAVKFGGSLGLNPKSYLLRAKGASEESFVENHNLLNVLEIYLKKGMSIYAQLINYFGEDEENKLIETQLVKGWWNQIPLQKSKQEFLSLINIQQKDFFDERNKPKLISLTHAVKEPLITPKVLKLFSTPNDHKHIEHIDEWLKEKEYQQYKIGINVIANRVDKNNPIVSLINSSFTSVELSSHFERLDAIGKIEFLRDITPTGALELWMRKEEFIDNPEQFVLQTKSATNHIPNEPVVSFVNSKFHLDYKIEFSNEIMSQLKDLKRVEDIDGINDVFRSLVTKLNLKYDFKTTCFEEREYYLKDISKFKGFFIDKNFNTDSEKALEKLEDYALPKIKNVKSKSELRFKVLVLNNSQPSKPDVAFAVTTIQETRTNPSSKKTISIQKGNIVTIYLKRGRLKSGKDERVGVIVDADSLYNKIFKDSELISKAGRDIVSDRYSNRSQYLQYGDIIIPENNEYKAAFDNELGIYHFLPKFDIEKQLWKFEVELDIKTEDGKQIHNPFINFSLVHFQPFSINYNNKTADASLLDLKNDCRISDIENSTWCYLLPERKLSVFFDTPGWFDDFGDVDLTVSFDYESLHHFNSDVNKWKVRSNFIVTVQGSNDGIQWQPVQSWFDNGKPKVDESTLAFHHPLLSEEILNNQENLAKLKLKFMKWVFPNNTEKSKSYSYFRVRFIEVEWFTNETWLEVLARNKELLSVDAVNSEEMRIRFVELIY